MVVVKTTYKAYLQFYPSFFGRCNGLPNLLQIGMDGFLTKYMLARLGSPLNHLSMRFGRSADKNGIDIGVCKNILRVFGALGNSQIVCKCLGFLVEERIGNGYHFGSRYRLHQVGNVQATDATGPQYTHFYFVHHVTFSPLSCCYFRKGAQHSTPILMTSSASISQYSGRNSSRHAGPS